MTISRRLLIFLALNLSAALISKAQDLPQDKKLSQDFMSQAVDIMAVTNAIDDARDIMITAANYDTTNVKANFEAGHMQIESLGKDLAVKYFLRIYRQNPNYRFDLEYWIGKSYQYGKRFDRAIEYFSRYKSKLTGKAGYSGKDKVEMSEVDRRIMECNNGKEFVANPKAFAITNIGREINSEHEDYGPVFNESETEVIFTSRRKDDNSNENVADDNKPYEDIYIAKKNGGIWSSAKNIGQPVNTKFNESTLTLSPDGSLLFIYRDEGGGDIFVSEKKGDSWSEPTPLPGIINSTYRESSVSITADEKTLYFASERPGGYGGSDIYVCTKDSKGEWSRVKNLGPKINTDLDEDGPFISFDAKTLFFSSEAHKGMGGFDIFKIELLNADKNEWGEPENIGYPINSPDDDIYYSISKDGKKSYYASVREDGLGYTDIYVITAAEEPKKQPEVVAKEPVKEEPKKEEPKKEEPKKEEPKKEEPKKEIPKKVIQPIKYMLTVVDADTKQPLEAKVRMQPQLRMKEQFQKRLRCASSW